MSKPYKPITAFSFDFLTPYFDFLSNLLGIGDKQKIKIVNLLDLKKGERLLDLGCGTGSLLIVTKNRHPNIEMIGVDVDEKVLEIAENKFKKTGLNIKLVKSSANKLPFPDNSFDAVVSTLVFHHLPIDIKKQALKEIHRVLK